MDLETKSSLQFVEIVQRNEILNIAEGSGLGQREKILFILTRTEERIGISAKGTFISVGFFFLYEIRDLIFLLC